MITNRSPWTESIYLIVWPRYHTIGWTNQLPSDWLTGLLIAYYPWKLTDLSQPNGMALIIQGCVFVQFYFSSSIHFTFTLEKKFSFGHPGCVPIMSKCYLGKKISKWTPWLCPYKFDWNSPSSNSYYLKKKYFFQFYTLVVPL